MHFNFWCVLMKQTFCFGLTQVDNRGRNFLHTAIQKSDIESVLFLISVHANVNSRTQDQHHLTPLHLAVMAGSEIIVRNLVSPVSVCCFSVLVCLSLCVCVCQLVGLSVSLSLSLHSSLPPSVLSLTHYVSLSVCLLPSSSPLSPPSHLIVASFSLSFLIFAPPPPFCFACLCSAICILAQPLPTPCPPPPPPPSLCTLTVSSCVHVCPSVSHYSPMAWSFSFLSLSSYAVMVWERERERVTLGVSNLTGHKTTSYLLPQFLSLSLSLVLPSLSLCPLAK